MAPAEGPFLTRAPSWCPLGSHAMPAYPAALRACTALSLVASTAIGVSAGQDSSPPVTFRAGVELVRLAVTVRENSGRLITDLTRDDFQIVVDRTPAEIRLFAK